MGKAGSVFPEPAAVVENLGRESLIYLDCQRHRSFDSESQDGYIAIQQSSQLAGCHGDRFAFGVSPTSFFVFDGNDETICFPQHSRHS